MSKKKQQRFKVVTRKYTTKSGVLVEKTYIYQETKVDGKWKRNRFSKPENYEIGRNFQVYNKKGELTKLGKAYFDDLKGTVSREEYSLIKKEYETLSKKRSLQGLATTVSTYESSSKESIAERLLYNSGYTFEDLAKETGIDELQLRKAENWGLQNSWSESKNEFFDPVTKTYWSFEYTYEEGFKFVRK